MRKVSFNELKNNVSLSPEESEEQKKLVEMSFQILSERWVNGEFTSKQLNRLNAKTRKEVYSYSCRQTYGPDCVHLLSLLNNEKNNDVFTATVFQIIWVLGRWRRADHECIMHLVEIAESRPEKPFAFIQNMGDLLSIPNELSFEAAHKHFEFNIKNNYVATYHYSSDIITGILNCLNNDDFNFLKGLDMLIEYLSRCRVITRADVVNIEDTLLLLDIKENYQKELNLIGAELARLLSIPENTVALKELYTDKNNSEHLLNSPIYSPETVFKMGQNLLENCEISNKIAEKILIEMLKDTQDFSLKNQYHMFLLTLLEQPNWGDIVFQACQKHRRKIGMNYWNIMIEISSRNDLSLDSWSQMLNVSAEDCRPGHSKVLEDPGTKIMISMAKTATSEDKLLAILRFSQNCMVGDPNSRKGTYPSYELVNYFFKPASSHFSTLPRKVLLENLGKIGEWRFAENYDFLPSTLIELYGHEPDLTAEEKRSVRNIFHKLNYEIKFAEEDSYWQKLNEVFENMDTTYRYKCQRLSMAL